MPRRRVKKKGRQVPVREPDGFKRDRKTEYHRGHATNRIRWRAVIFGLLLGLDAIQIQTSLEDSVSESFVYRRRTEILKAFQGNGPVDVEDLLPKEVLGRPPGLGRLDHWSYRVFVRVVLIAYPKTRREVLRGLLSKHMGVSVYLSCCFCCR